MSKERLEEIDKNKAMSNDDVVIEEDDYNWLIEQTELVKELEHQNTIFYESFKNIADKIYKDFDWLVVTDVIEQAKRAEELERKNKRYREHLQKFLDLQLYINYTEKELWQEVLKISDEYLDEVLELE